MKRILPVFFIALFFLHTDLSADVGEGQLAHFKSAFMSKIIADNPGRESEIRGCLGSIVKQGSSGARLIDRFGLFLYDSSRNSLELQRIRFFKSGGNALFFIIMRDPADDQLYSLYLEYAYTGGGSIRLNSTYFSKVYSEKIKSVTRFFSGE